MDPRQRSAKEIGFMLKGEKEKKKYLYFLLGWSQPEANYEGLLRMGPR
jgi:hypothetical protein